jgi:hypothetical protein
MDGAGSFRVHLDALKDFSAKVRDEADAVRTATDALAVGDPVLPLGAFAEAFSLSDEHRDVVEQMGEVLAEIRQALEFAERVTSHVAAGYEALSVEGAAGLHARGGARAATPFPFGVAAPPPVGPSDG